MSLFGFHHRTEFVLFGYKGKLKMYPKRKTMPTLIVEHTWRNHSHKPDLFYNYAEAFGSPRIDLFAKQKREGWDAWGNGVESDIDLNNYGKIS
jgi:N6-adenosine-specific RNA methylase IME4